MNITVRSPLIRLAAKYTLLGGEGAFLFHFILSKIVGYLNIYCNSKFHASCEAIIRQLPEITVTITEI